MYIWQIPFLTQLTEPYGIVVDLQFCPCTSETKRPGSRQQRGTHRRISADLDLPRNLGKLDAAHSHGHDVT